MPVARKDHVDLQLAQDGHHVAGVAQVVDVASRARDGEDVVVDHEYPRPTIPAPELGVEPAVVLAPDLSLVEIRLGRVERDDFCFSLGDWDLGRPLPYAEELLEVPVADILGVVVAHRVDYVRTLQTVEILFCLLELPAISLHRKIPHDGYQVRLQSVALLDGGLQEILPKQPRTHVDIGHLYYTHPSLPSETWPVLSLRKAFHRLQERLRLPELLIDRIRSRGAGGDLVLHAPARCKQPFWHLRERGMRRRELALRHVLKRYSQVLAPQHEPPYSVMGLSERNSLRREEVCQLRGEGETPCRLGQPSAVEARCPQHLGQDGEHGEHRVDRVEERSFILLEVFRVAEREALEGDHDTIQ